MITTNRLLLRNFRQDDWQAVHAYATDIEVIRYVPGELPSEEETLQAVHSWVNGLVASPPHHDFAITTRPNDFVIGWCCLQLSQNDDRIGELMYVLNRKFWERGYATEAAQAVVDFGFSRLGLQRIFATCRPENAASWHVLEKLGMQREGLLRQNIWIRGSWCDSYLYAILKDEWESKSISR